MCANCSCVHVMNHIRGHLHLHLYTLLHLMLTCTPTRTRPPAGLAVVQPCIKRGAQPSVITASLRPHLNITLCSQILEQVRRLAGPDLLVTLPSLHSTATVFCPQGESRLLLITMKTVLVLCFLLCAAYAGASDSYPHTRMTT